MKASKHTLSYDYNISESTAYLIEALRSFQESQEHLLSALTIMHGEEKANEILLSEYGSASLQYSTAIYSSMGLSISDNLLTKSNTI